MKIEEFSSKTTDRVTRLNQAEETASKCKQDLIEKEQAMDLQIEELKVCLHLLKFLHPNLHENN